VFLEYISRGMTIGKAADEVGVDRIRLRRFIKEDADFRERLESAQVDADEEVQEAVWLAATSGNPNAAKRWFELRGRRIDAGVASPASAEPEVDPLADLGGGDVVALDPRRRESS
jgi:hypothetical protein